MDTLPDVLARVKIDRKPYATLLAYVQDVEAMVAYYKRCVQRGEQAMNLSFLA